MERKKMLNRKGYAGDWVDFGGFVLILILIAGGIVGSYVVFFKDDFNVKEFESGIILGKVEKCFFSQETLSFFEDGFDFVKECGFNENVRENHLIYVKDLSFSEEGEGEVFFGVYDYLVECGLVDKKSVLPKCAEKKVSLKDKEYRVVVGSNQKSRRVAV